MASATMDACRAAVPDIAAIRAASPSETSEVPTGSPAPPDAASIGAVGAMAAATTCSAAMPVTLRMQASHGHPAAPVWESADIVLEECYAVTTSSTATRRGSRRASVGRPRSTAALAHKQPSQRELRLATTLEL